jgi:choline dehydrogenase-like flavoprotein
LISAPAVSPHTVHLSFYGYSDDLPDRVRDLRPGLARLAGPLLGRATRQLVFAIGFLHSDDSARFTSVLDDGRFRLVPGSRTKALAAVARVKRRLLEDLSPLGMLPLAPAAEVAPPGGGYHYGGSLPMREHPTSGESDLFGRPVDSDRVHVVDAAAFPSIPGGPITLTIMANAHRIASASAAM